MPGVLVTSNVVPGPAVEAPLLNVGDVIRGKIVAEFIPLVDRSPEVAGLWG